MDSGTGIGDDLERAWAALHDATGGRPELSRKFHEEMQPFGCDQELLVALRTRGGENWGMVGLYREVGRPRFTYDEIDAVRRVAPVLAVSAVILAAYAVFGDAAARWFAGAG